MSMPLFPPRSDHPPADDDIEVTEWCQGGLIPAPPEPPKKISEATRWNIVAAQMRATTMPNNKRSLFRRFFG